MRQKRAKLLRRENPSAPRPGRKGGGPIEREERGVALWTDQTARRRRRASRQRGPRR